MLHSEGTLIPRCGKFHKIRRGTFVLGWWWILSAGRSGGGERRAPLRGFGAMGNLASKGGEEVEVFVRTHDLIGCGSDRIVFSPRPQRHVVPGQST